MNENETAKKLITVKVNETTLKAWKQFCLDHDYTMTNAIKKAMREMIANENENVSVSDFDGETITLQLSKDTLQKLVK